MPSRPRRTFTLEAENMLLLDYFAWEHFEGNRSCALNYVLSDYRRDHPHLSAVMSDLGYSSCPYVSPFSPVR